ncbi:MULTISPECIES: hypothetical protein [Streptomyces]|uniref:hypothetical protein n=1 Tax=Streptomyces TaxID=1883 RepID=UPI0018FE4B5C|nr:MULTISPECIES: hypothetical protein [Streptomyces]MDX2917500.1 hypothetical protein [Streptomyces sp. NE06-03C]MDX3608569.1 hypothetical protein [Streptomyces sp. FL06-04B]MDX3734229.1 hypothetical protein [Streptomyces sp. ID01-15D]
MTAPDSAEERKNREAMASAPESAMADSATPIAMNVPAATAASLVNRHMPPGVFSLPEGPDFPDRPGSMDS